MLVAVVSVSGFPKPGTFEGLACKTDSDCGPYNYPPAKNSEWCECGISKCVCW